ncbi:MAG: exo-alpha-sialidase [Sphingobacteriales bacterium]|nr:exo-alpha-sialidase [Sphingobacteriales bacterium]
MKQFLTVLMLAGFFAACTDSRNEKQAEVPAAVKMINSPAADSCAEPYLFTDKNGMIYLSWVEKKGKEAELKFSSLVNEQWSEPTTIAAGKNWFVNWADYPLMAGDGNGNIIAHYLEKSDTAKFTYDIKMVASADSGRTWNNAMLLNEDNKKAEHGFVSIVPYKDGFFACWLDGRKTASEESHAGHDGHHGEMTVRAAKLDKSGKKINEWELDGRVCDCCQTTAAITSSGPVVIYRDRSDEEIRDMSIVRLINGQWTSPEAIHTDNWKINACPVNGPRADAIGNNLAIAWFSMPGKKAEVKVVFSNDGGASFGTPIRLDEGNSIGRVDLVMLDSLTALVSWMEGGNIKAVKVHSDGSKEPSIMIASSSEKRSGGFPQMTKSGNRIIFAWTDDIKKTIRLAQTSAR